MRYFGADGRLCYETTTSLQGLTLDMAYQTADGRAFHIVNNGTTITYPDGSST